MTDDIKNILDDLKDEECYYANIDGRFHIDLNKDEASLLLDYITNLQQENERLKDQNINEILKKDLEICTKQYKKSEEKLEKYKSRVEKAVEYINCNKQKTICAYGDNEDDDFEICLWEEDTDNLLNILNGRSNE